MRFDRVLRAFGAAGVAVVAVAAMSAQSFEPKSIVKPAPGVEVIMIPSQGHEPDPSDPADWVYAATWQLRDSTGVQTLDAGEISGLWPGEAVLQRARQMVIWAPPYLLLHRACTGTAWTCRGTTVFRVRDGKAGRIGYLPGELDLIIPAAGGTGPKFRAVYAKLEHALIQLSHAGSPVMVLILQDDGDHLVLDATATCSDQVNREPALDARPGEGERYLSQLARIAMVQKYCDRAAPLARTMEAAERTLSARDYRDLVAVIASVQSFEVP